MEIRRVKTRKDLRGARCGQSALEVETTIHTDGGRVSHPITAGILYRRTKGGFSMIEPMFDGAVGWTLGRTQYSFGHLTKTEETIYGGSGSDADTPLAKGTPEYKHYGARLNMLAEERGRE